jgi:predicted nuclease with TOPRIM domain
MKEVIIALIGALSGGVGVTLIQQVFQLREKHLDESTSIRKELREENKSLKEQYWKLGQELEAWRDRFYKLKEDRLKEQEKYEVEFNALQEKYDELLEKYNALLNPPVQPTSTTLV